jgi:hypothetical protein
MWWSTDMLDKCEMICCKYISNNVLEYQGSLPDPHGQIKARPESVQGSLPDPHGQIKARPESVHRDRYR